MTPALMVKMLEAALAVAREAEAEAPAPVAALMSVKEVAAELGLSERYVLDLCSRHELDTVPMGKARALKIERASVERFIQRRRMARRGTRTRAA